MEVSHLLGHVVGELLARPAHAESFVRRGHPCKELCRVGSASRTPPLDTTSSVDPLAAAVRAELATGAVRIHDTRTAAVRVDELVDGIAPEEVRGNGLFRGPVAGRVEVLEAEVDHLCFELPVVEFAGVGLVEHVVERVALLADDLFDEVREVDLPDLGLEFEYLLPDLLWQLDGLAVLDFERGVDLHVLLHGAALDFDLLGDRTRFVLVAQLRRLFCDGDLDLQVCRLLDDDVLGLGGDRNDGVRAGGDIEGQVLSLLGDLEADRAGLCQLDGRDACLGLHDDECLGPCLDVNLGVGHPNDGCGHAE